MPQNCNGRPNRSIRQNDYLTFSVANIHDCNPMDRERDHTGDRTLTWTRSVDRRVSLTTLDEDVALQILSDLAVDDVISLRKTSKDLTSLSRLRTVWHNAFVSNILSQNIPVPSLPAPFPNLVSSSEIPSLSSKDLEILTRESLAVNLNWTSPLPSRTFSARLKTKSMKVLAVRFLPAPARSNKCQCPARPGSEWLTGRYFYTFGYIAEGLYSLQIWDAEAVLGSHSAGSKPERIRRDDEDDSDNVKVVSEWLGSGRTTGLAVCESTTSAEGALLGFCSVYQDRHSSTQRITLRIFSFSPEHPETQNGGIYAPDDMLRTLRNLMLARPATLLSLTESRVILEVKGVDTTQENLVLVRDWRSGWAKNYDWEVILRPSKDGMNKQTLAVHVFYDFILVFRESVLDMYFLPSDFDLPSSLHDRCDNALSYVSVDSVQQSSSRSPPSAHRTSNPTTVRRVNLRSCASYKWNWPLNSLAVTQRASWHHDQAQTACRSCFGSGEVGNRRACLCAYRPLSIAIRFDSYFPWPVNLIHHYEIRPSESSSDFDPATLNPLDFVLPINAVINRDGGGANVSPFTLPPQNTQIVPSSVRLFGRTNLVLGQHGTLIWLDSESDYIPSPLLQHGTAERPTHALIPRYLGVGEDAIETEGFALSAGTGERIASIHLPLTTPVASNSCKTKSERMPPSLVSSRNNEGWTTSALDERAGRIIVGDNEGFVEVWDYY